VTLDEVRACKLDDVESAVVNIPFSAREGRSDLRPHKAFERRVERITRRYTAELIEWFGPEPMCPLLISHQNEQTMAWIMDTYSMHVRHTTTAVVTGKPIDLGGSRGRQEATGRGLLFNCGSRPCQVPLCKHLNTRGHHSGVWQRRSMAAKLMHNAGYKIVGVADIHGALYNENGFDVPKLLDLGLRRAQTAAGFPDGGRNVRTSEILFQPAEIVFPAAVENQITSENEHRLQTRILWEGAKRSVHGDGRRDRRPQKAYSSSRHSRQCRRRDGELF